MNKCNGDWSLRFAQTKMNEDIAGKLRECCNIIPMIRGMRVMLLAALMCISVCPLQSIAAGVVLWNKLGSDAEITHSEVGPGGEKSFGNFTPGPFPSFGQAFVNSDPNPYAYALTFPAESVISKSKGTVAFWARLNNFPSALFDFITPLASVASAAPALGWRVGFGSNNGCGGAGLYGTVGVAKNAYCSGLVDTATQSGTLDSILGDRAAWHHYAMVWNETGIPQLGGRKVYLYIDGKLKTTPYYHDGSPWGSIPGGSHFALAYYVNIQGASVAVDNLVVYDYVKTDFSDRFNENPLTALPLHATAVSPTSIRLTWEDSSSDEKGFRIQRKAGACNAANPWSTRADVGANAETFLDGQLLADTAYAYRVSRYYGASNFSPYSRCAAATTGAAGTPKLPSILRAYSASSSRVELSWDDVAEDETAFEIYRQDGSGSMTLLDTVAESAQSFSDTTATGNDTTTSYHYDVRACNASGCSVPAPAPVVPSKPVSLKATVASTVQLTWQDKSNDESRFEIERKNGVCGSGNPWVQVGTVAANTQAYQDRSAVKGTVYAYRVRAYYHTGVLLRGFSASQAYGFSGFTGCVSATAP